MGVDTFEARDVNLNGYQSYVIILLSVDINDKKVSCISILRDTEAVIDKLEQDGKYTTITGEKTTKINADFSYGGGAKKQSYQNTVRAVSRLLGTYGNIPIDYYIGLNMDGFPAVIDTVGGLEFTVEFDFTYYDFEMVKRKRKIWNGGEQTMYYVRSANIFLIPLTAI